MNRLFEEFPPVSTAEWEAQLARDLKGRDGKTLVWHTEDGIAVKPYYRRDDVASLPLPEPSAAGRSWHIGCEVNDVEAVEQALAHGAQGLIVPIALVKHVPLYNMSIHVKTEPSACLR